MPTPRPLAMKKPPETLAERFWSIARDMDVEPGAGSQDPATAVRHVLRVLDAFDRGAVGDGVTVNTLSFLMLLRQQELAGDLLYASPEQARGEVMDERSLVFSVGVLLFEKLTGRHPFGAEGNPRRVARIQKGEMGSGVNYFPTVPAGLRSVLMRAMGPFPEERWESLAAMRAQLVAFLAESAPAPAAAAPPAALEAAATPVIVSRGTARDDDPTRIVPRTPRERLPGVPAAPPPAAAEERSRGPGLRRAAPLGWAALGAAIASSLFLVLSPIRHPAAPAAAPPPPADPPVTTVAPVARPAPAVAPAEAAAPAAPAAPVATAAPAEFDPQLGGDRALALAGGCFDAARLSAGVHFGAGLLYAHADGLTRKVYFSASDGLSPAERKCLRAAFTGLSAGPAPAASVIVEYSFRVRASGGEVRVR